MSHVNPSVTKVALHVLSVALPQFPLAIIQVRRDSSPRLTLTIYRQRCVGAVQKLIQLFDCLIESEIAKPTSLLPSSAADSKVAHSSSEVPVTGGLSIIEDSTDSNTSRPTKRTRVDSTPRYTSSTALSLHTVIRSIGKEIIFQSIGTLLLTASPLLPIDLRTQIERIICSGLLTLQKGILRLSTSLPSSLSTFSSSHSTNIDVLDKNLSISAASNSASASLKSTNKQRIRRLNCESIRSDPIVQNQFLIVAYYDIATRTSDGGRSGNISILKDVCQICSKYFETQFQSLEILTHLECQFFPSGGSSHLPLVSQHIPSTVYRELASHEENYAINQMRPLIEQQREKVNDFIAGHKRRGEEVFSGASGEIESGQGAATSVSAHESSVDLSPGVVDVELGQGPFTKSMMVLERGEKEQHQQQRQQQQEERVQRVPTPAPPLQMIPKVKMSAVTKDGPQSVDEESEDDLPDINLADPDQN
jgi:hypothetical protein